MMRQEGKTTTMVRHADISRLMSSWLGMYSALLFLGVLPHSDQFIQIGRPQSHSNLSELLSPQCLSSGSPRCEAVLSHESSLPERQSFLLPHLSNRRSVLSSIFTVAAGSQASYADSVKSVITDDQTYLQCLSDLPPIPDDCVRIYLCRHGQTENNRLHLVQGARADPPLNQNGIAMAQRLGLALAQLPERVTTIFHSPLIRSRQTAVEASQQMKLKSPKTPLRTKLLPCISEVDFGSIAEGKPINEVRLEMAVTYAAWASGNIDVRLQGGGESGREVLQRTSQALRYLTHTAKMESTRQVAAISHSTYLRILLATILNISLAQSALLEQVNGCINVVDLSKSKNLQCGPKSTLFGGFLSQASSDFHLIVPKGTVVRINEKRHLEGIQTGNL